MTPDPTEAGRRVRIPADVDRPDTVLAGLTPRQLAILAVAAVAVWVLWVATRRVVPVPVFAALAAPIGAVAGVLALGRRDGVSADRLVRSAFQFHCTPRHLLPALTAAGRGDGGERLGPLHLPVRGVSASGVVDLGGLGCAVVCRASAVTFALRTPAEQCALVAVFGRWLNGLVEPVQIVLRSTPTDLGPAIAELRAGAAGLPHPALEAAALAHASFLRELSVARSPLSREVFVVLRHPTPAGPGARQVEDGEAVLLRRAAEAADALAGAGVALTRLDGPAVWEVLAASADPSRSRRPEGMAGPDTVIAGPTDGEESW